MKEAGDLGPSTKSRFLDAIIVTLLFTLFWITYFHNGLKFSEVDPNFSGPMLRADPYIVTRVLCDRSYKVVRSHRSTAHPLFPLFFKPIGIFLKNRIGRTNASLAFTSFFGCVGLVFFYAVLRKTGLHPTHASVFSLILGMSTTHLLFSSIPETYIFSFASVVLMLLLYLCILNHKRFVPAHFAASVFATGITTTALSLSVIVLIARFRKMQIKKMLLLIGLFLLALFACMVGLLFLQKEIYPVTKIVVAKEWYSSNAQFLSFDVFQHPLAILSQRTRNFLFFNVIADRVTRGCVGLSSLEDLGPLTIAALIIYILYCVIALVLIIRNRLYKKEMFMILLTYFAANYCLHLFYGNEFHLYAPHYTFALIAMIAFPFTRSEYMQKRALYLFTGIAGLLFVLIAMNNLLFVKSIQAMK